MKQLEFPALGRAMTCTLILGILAPGASGSDPPDAMLNPSTGAIEVVDTSNRFFGLEVRHSVNLSNGDPPTVVVLTDDPADDREPRLAVSSSGDTWVVWWRDAQVDQVLVRKRHLASGVWDAEQVVSLTGDSSRAPSIAYDGQLCWVAYEFDQGGSLGTAVRAIHDDPDPFGSLAVLGASSSVSGADPFVRFEDGHLWVTWVYDEVEVAWSELDYGASTWSLPSYESYENDDIPSARNRIRLMVLGE